MQTSEWNRGSALPLAADLYGDIDHTSSSPSGPREYLPGLAVTGAATLAAAYISDHYGAPLTLMALLIGLALNFLNADPRLGPGLNFASRTLLRCGIVLVGARVTMGQIVGLGPMALALVAAIIALTFLAGVVVSRTLGFGAAFGTLAGGAVAICGASAAMALATTLGEKRINQAQLALVLVGISAMSSFAMFLYPIIAHHLALTDNAAGFMLGASIHDVAQALGAGYSYSQPAGEIAAIVKLTRVAMLAPALAIVAFFFPRQESGGPGVSVLPWFIIGFFVLAGINSTGIIPHAVGTGAQTMATGLLACAVTATGIRSPMNALLNSGPRPLLAIAAATLVALVLAIIAALAFIH